MADPEKVNIKFKKERLILCEGTTDKAFFCQLIQAKRLPDFQVQYPWGVTETSGGLSKYSRFLNGAKSVEFEKIVRGILLVADRDSDSAAQFRLVTSQLRDRGFGVPDRELQYVRSPNGLPSVAIMMLPLNRQIGNLESVVLPVALEHWAQMAGPLNTYFGASEAGNWEVGKQDKMKVQCLIAATCEPNPYGSLSTIYTEDVRYHLPLDSPHLEDVAQVLRDFDAGIAAAA
jgi:hypothetical protein